MDESSRVSLLSVDQMKAYETAVGLWHVRGTPLERYDLTKCPATIKRGHPRYVGKQCTRKAGQGTLHEGYGNCVAHGGAKRYGRALGAWLMAMQFAQEYDLTPWEALLYVVRITAGRVRYCEYVLAQATDDREIEGRVHEGEPTGVSEHGELMQGRNLRWWVDTSERERMMLARVSKAAIDAGVAQLMIEKEMRAGEQIAMTLTRTLDALDSEGIPQDIIAKIRGIMSQELREMDGGGVVIGEVKVIEGGHG